MKATNHIFVNIFTIYDIDGSIFHSMDILIMHPLKFNNICCYDNVIMLVIAN